MANLLNEYKTIFWESRTNFGTLRKLSPYNGVSSKFVFRSIKSLDKIFLDMVYFVQDFRMPNLLNEHKLLSVKDLGTSRDPSKTFSLYWSFLLICFEVFQSLNRIFQAMEHQFKDLEWQIWSTNKNLFFWDSDENLKTLQKPFSFIAGSYILALKSFKTLNRILWAMKLQFEALEYKICWTNRKRFF